MLQVRGHENYCVRMSKGLRDFVIPTKIIPAFEGAGSAISYAATMTSTNRTSSQDEHVMTNFVGSASVHSFVNQGSCSNMLSSSNDELNDSLNIASFSGHEDGMMGITGISYGWEGSVPLSQALRNGNDGAVESVKKSSAATSETSREMEMRLFYVAVGGDLLEVRKVIESGVSVNSTDYNGSTALHLAADRGHPDVVEHLLACGANIDAEDNSGHTALTLALKRNRAQVVRVLQAAGALRHSSRRKSKETVLHLARFAVMAAFPRPIALAMLEGRRVASISKPAVSMFFSDIVGFTSLSSGMASASIAQLLNRLFRKFDKLAFVHGIQKVDIIGDAYIAAANFMEDQPDDHAARLARFAADALLAAAETIIDSCGSRGGASDPEASVQIRIGLHCGPVSGSVVGLQNFKYTLMGDAVNTASRMESTGLPGRIQCSEAMALLIAEQAHEIVLKPREGGVQVKGKGHMKTYWMSSLRRGLRSFGSCPELSPPPPPPCRGTTACWPPRRASWVSQESDGDLARRAIYLTPLSPPSRPGQRSASQPAH